MRVLVDGAATGEVAVLDAPLSFWGGYDPKTGTIIDSAHPQHGETLAGKVVYMPHGRGSSSSSTVLAEALRLGTGPAAIILGEPDSMVVTAVLVAGMLYGSVCPVVVGPVPGDGVWRVTSSGVEPVD